MIIKENDYYEDEKYTRFFHNPYLNYRIDCARCGKHMKISDLFKMDTRVLSLQDALGDYSEDLYSPIKEVNPEDYDENYRNKYIQGLVPVVTEENDDEGYHFRCFCKSCWNKIWDMSDEDIFNKYEVSYME